MATPTWLDTEQLPSIIAIVVTDNNISTIADYTAKQINIQYLTQFIYKHSKAEYAIEFKNTLNLENIKQTATLLSQLLSLVCQFSARYAQIEDGTNVNIWDILFKQLTVNITNGKLWKIKPISFPTNITNSAIHYTHITELYSNLIRQHTPIISITFELTDMWIDVLVNEKYNFLSLRNAIIHSTNLGELYIDIDFHLLKEPGYKYLNFILDLFKAIQSNQSISSLRWQCYNQNTKNITNYNIQEFATEIENKFWPNFIECFTLTKLLPCKQLIPYKRGYFFSNGCKDIRVNFIVDYFIGDEVKYFLNYKSLTKLLDALNQKQNRNCVNSLIIDCWNVTLAPSTVYALCDLICVENNDNCLEELQLQAQFDDDKLFEIFINTITQQNNQLHVLELWLADQNKTVNFSKHYVNVIKNINSSKCPMLYSLFISDIDLENQFKNKEENKMFVDAFYMFLERVYCQMMFVRQYLLEVMNMEIDCVNLIHEYLKMSQIYVELYFSMKDELGYEKVLCEYSKQKLLCFVKQNGIKCDVELDDKSNHQIGLQFRKCIDFICDGSFEFVIQNCKMYI